MKKLFFLLLLLEYAHASQAQIKIDSPEALKNWLPTSLLGFAAEPESYSAELIQDNAPYFVAAKKYTKGSAVVNIVVFDYRKSSERIRSVTDFWSMGKEIDDALISSANAMVAGCKSQELVDKSKKSAQLYLYHADRYLITISSATEDVAFLKSVAENLRPTNLPE